MNQIIHTLGVSWGVGNIIYGYLSGHAWWSWMIDAGFLVAGIVTGGIAQLIKTAVRQGLKYAIRSLSSRAAISL